MAAVLSVVLGHWIQLSYIPVTELENAAEEITFKNGLHANNLFQGKIKLRSNEKLTPLVGFVSLSIVY